MQFVTATGQAGHTARGLLAAERYPTGKRIWVAQAALAAVFLFAGVAKLAMSGDDLADQSPLPVPFLQFIAVCEILGAAGLVLPGLLGVMRGLTPLAAAGLVVIMAGAVAITLADGGGAAALLPFVAGIIAAYVVKAYWLGRAV